ncbi:MAG: hypothetical protein AAB383_05285 [Patescibacteria group bacterium]
MVTIAKPSTKSKQPILYTHYVSLNNKKYPYSLRLVDENVSWVECEGAKIAQEFLHEDIPALLLDLPYLIESTKEYEKNQENMIRFRISNEDKKAIQQKAAKLGYKSISSYLRDLALRD